MKCPNCKINLSNPSECLECGWESKKIGSYSNEIPPIPKTCSVSVCENDTAINYLFVENEAGQVFTPKTFEKVGYRRDGKYYLVSGYTFVRHIARCSDCHARENKKTDWREQTIQDQMKNHPEFAIKNPTNEDRESMIRMAKSFKHTPLPYKKEHWERTSEEVLTGWTITKEDLSSVDLSKFPKHLRGPGEDDDKL